MVAGNGGKYEVNLKGNSPLNGFLLFSMAAEKIGSHTRPDC
jgi:hypothetical protein